MNLRKYTHRKIRLIILAQSRMRLYDLSLRFRTNPE